jgi:hypothetical protein
MDTRINYIQLELIELLIIAKFFDLQKTTSAAKSKPLTAPSSRKRSKRQLLTV